jgi:protein-disulfide isomerase
LSRPPRLFGSAPLAFAQGPTQEELMRPRRPARSRARQGDAPVTIVEYASMTCPHCATFHKTTYPELKKKYIDTGKVRFIFREFPLDELAVAASMLARCAGRTTAERRWR